MQKSKINFDKIDSRKGLGNIIAATCSDKGSSEVTKKLFEKLLNDKQREVVFGIFFEGKDLKTVADECDITRERARQYKENAVVYVFRRELYTALKELENYTKPKVEEKIDSKTEAFFIEFPDLSVRAYNVLRGLELFTIADLANQKLSDLRKTRMWGRKVEIELTEFLQTRNLSFQGE